MWLLLENYFVFVGPDKATVRLTIVSDGDDAASSDVAGWLATRSRSRSRSCRRKGHGSVVGARVAPLLVEQPTFESYEWRPNETFGASVPIVAIAAFPSLAPPLSSSPSSPPPTTLSS
ncbi:hypothetical protein MUK42_11177 [Musa troglodytarum]|uniref:Uncharacterized protein n=1 Tax=Musa troglodytarum TaxID=320322 RepID=A0A9E7H7T9_9LILI|nr:hypothetical protein MUK42_11177 [Musa troglodytarum]